MYVERGRVVGVELAGGERVSGRLVIADVTPHALLRLAGDALDGRYAAELRRYRHGPATLKVDWALSGPIPWTAPEAREAGTVHVGGSEREVLDALAPGGGEPARAAVPAPRPAVARRPDARARRAAHRVGLHPRAAGGRLGERDRPPGRAHGGPGRALRARLSGSHPRPPRPGPGRPGAPQRQPRRRRRRRGVLHARPGRLPAAPEPVARTARPCAASTSAAPRRSRAVRCTACPATPPPARRSPRRGSAGRCPSACGRRRFYRSALPRTIAAPTTRSTAPRARKARSQPSGAPRSSRTWWMPRI